MEIKIIGNGISAHLAALKYIKNPLKWDRQDDYFTLPMSSTLDLIPFLKDSIDIEYKDFPDFNAIPKTGVRKTNFGCNDFYSNFTAPYVAMHFDSWSFNNYIYKNLNIKEAKDTDYIIQTKKPVVDNSYNLITVPVNAAIGIRIPNKSKRTYTHLVAEEHGWVQIIPTYNYIYMYYVYNKNITSTEEIKDYFKVFKQDYFHAMDFNSYYKKDPFQDNYLHLGLNAFFIEPFDATSLSGALRLLDLSQDIMNKTIKKDHALFLYNDYIKEALEVLMLHYVSRVPFNSEFWNRANDIATDYLINNKHVIREPSNFYSKEGFNRLYKKLGLSSYIQ